MFNFKRPIAGLTIALMLAAPLAAKPLSRILAESGLSPDDFNIMRNAEATLYVDTQIQTGKTVSWNNPDTTSHGTVQVTARKDNCVNVRHEFHPQAKEQKTLQLMLCKNAEGKWLLMP